MKNLRDKAFEHADRLVEGRSKGVPLRTPQNDLRTLDEQQRGIARRYVREVVDAAIHDFLFAVQEAHDCGLDPRVTIGGIEVASLSDGLHGERLARLGGRPGSVTTVKGPRRRSDSAFR